MAVPIRPSLTIAANHSGTHERTVKVQIRTPEGIMTVIVSPDQFGRAVTGESEVDLLEYTWRPVRQPAP